jgi:hypothetical protein
VTTRVGAENRVERTNASSSRRAVATSMHFGARKGSADRSRRSELPAGAA